MEGGVPEKSNPDTSLWLRTSRNWVRLYAIFKINKTAILALEAGYCGQADSDDTPDGVAKKADVIVTR